MAPKIKTTAIFLQPFEFVGLNEVLPAGEYEIEIERYGPVDCTEIGKWTSSVLVHLHPRASHPGLSRTLTVPLTELERAIAKDKLTGKALTDFFLEEMLADPMICLVMQADGVSEEEVRGLYSGLVLKSTADEDATLGPGNTAKVERLEGMSLRPVSRRPGIEVNETRRRSMDQATFLECLSGHAPESEAVTDRTIDLDGCRTPAGRLEATLRRRGAAPHSSPAPERIDVGVQIDAAMQAGPARSWIEATDRVRFLLERYAVCPGAQDAPVQTLIKRSLVDLARLKKREDDSS